MDEKIKETLKRQLELLSERSKDSKSDKDLADLTHAMCEVVDRIPSKFVPSCGGQSI